MYHACYKFRSYSPFTWSFLARCDRLQVHCLEIYKLLCPLLKLSLKTWLCTEPLSSSGGPLGSGLGSWKCPHSRRTQVAARAQSRTGSAHLKCPTIERKPGNNHRPDDWADYKQFMYWQGWAVSVAYIHECPLEILGNNQLDALVHLFIYFMSLHVSSVRALIIRRSNCINT